MSRKQKKRGYGFGRIFPRGPHRILWIGYSAGRGQKERRESSGSTSWSVASKLLKRRQGEVAAGKVIVSPAKQEKYTVAEMLDFLLPTHQVIGDSKAVQWPVKHLRRYFGFDRAMAITDERVLRYVQDRRNQGAADGTIKLELAAL